MKGPKHYMRVFQGSVRDAFEQPPAIYAPNTIQSALNDITNPEQPNTRKLLAMIALVRELQNLLTKQ